MTLSRRRLIAGAGTTLGLTAMGIGMGGAVPALASAAGSAALGPWFNRGELAMSVDVGLQSTIYYPSSIRDLGRLPVIVWGNGTGGVPYVYRELFRHWVSRGNIVLASNTPNPAFGILMRDSIDDILRKDKSRLSRFYQRIDIDRLATSGHSQGGMAAINAGQDERVATVIPIQPGPLADVKQLHSPMLLLTGEADLIVYPPLYVEGWMRDRAEVPMVYASLKDGGHFNSVLTDDGGDFRAITAAWLQAMFENDAAAKRVFFGNPYGLADDPQWLDVSRNKAGDEYWPGEALSRDGVPIDAISEKALNDPEQKF